MGNKIKEYRGPMLLECRELGYVNVGELGYDNVGKWARGMMEKWAMGNDREMG